MYWFDVMTHRYVGDRHRDIVVTVCDAANNGLFPGALHKRISLLWSSLD